MNQLDEEESSEETKIKHNLELKMLHSRHLYEIWSGNNRFYFSGRIMVGPINDIGVKTTIN